MINEPLIHHTVSYFSKLVHYLPHLMNLKQDRPEDRGIKILLVDDHPLVRQWVRRSIERQSGMEVIGEVTNGEEAITLSRKLLPDIILMDINMPGIGGIEATRRITAEMPDICIIGLSTHDEDNIVKDMKNAGASAYLSKTEAFESLIGTIRTEASYISRAG